MITSLDGHVELQDSQTAPVATNKIKINITKNVAAKTTVAAAAATIDGGSMPIEVITGMGQSSSAMIDELPPAVFTAPEPAMSFEYKESMRNHMFDVIPVTESGIETSGLCSIM